MDEYPIVGKLCSWPTVVGFIAGAFIVAFVVYPPHVGWGDGMKWGDVATWFGSIMSGGAAIAAWYAARSALKLARLPVDQQESFRKAKSRAISAAILQELAAARAITASAQDRLPGLKEERDRDLISASLKFYRIDKLAMMERFLPDLSAFGEDDSMWIVFAASEMMNFNSEFDRIESRLQSRINALMIGRTHINSCIDDAINVCKITHGAVDRAIGAIRKHIDPGARQG